MKAPWRLRNAASGVVVVEQLAVAAGFWSRFKGLQLRSSLPAGCGLLLVPCSSIHTCLMRFAIDVVMLDAHGRVLQVKRQVKPWRLALAPRGTHAVLELPAGSACVQQDETLYLDVDTDEAANIPSQLAFLRPTPPRETES